MGGETRGRVSILLPWCRQQPSLSRNSDAKAVFSAKVSPVACWEAENMALMFGRPRPVDTWVSQEQELFLLGCLPALESEASVFPSTNIQNGYD